MKETTTNPQANLLCLRTELRKEFVRRCKQNPAYSMRAFAKFLAVDQSLLSKLMSGKRSISAALIEKISPKLNIKPSQMTQLLQDRHSPEAIQYQQMADDEVSVLAEWIHFTLLELIKTKGFKAETKWIADRLNVHTQEVEDAVERLKRMGFIAVEAKAFKLLKPNNNWSNNASTTVARQELQRSILKQSQQALESVDFSLRDHGSLTVAVRIDRLMEFKEKLKQVRAELDAFFQPLADEADFDEVYQLSLSFFPITKELKNKNEENSDENK